MLSLPAGRIIRNPPARMALELPPILAVGWTALPANDPGPLTDLYTERGASEPPVFKIFRLRADDGFGRSERWFCTLPADLARIPGIIAL